MPLEKIKRPRGVGEIEYVEKKSIFIAYSAIAKNEEQALEIIKERKKKYADATHNVYAYITENGTIQRYSDDAEPQGTAGMPVLSAIRKCSLIDTCVVVTRYFGGILLGAGGLVRAYSSAASKAIEAGGIAVFEEYTVMSVDCSYSDYQKLTSELSAFSAKIDSTEFSSSVNVIFAVKKEKTSVFLKRTNEIFAARLIFKVVCDRFDFE